MDAPNEVIHQSLRLRVMATLVALPDNESLEFTRLRTILSVTDGNLGAHLATLESAGYLSMQKDFVSRRPRTRVMATDTGRHAFARHVAFLRHVIEGSSTSDVSTADQGPPQKTAA